jgi:hypothetical protein
MASVVFGHELAPAAFQREGWLEIVPAFPSRKSELTCVWSRCVGHLVLAVSPCTDCDDISSECSPYSTRCSDEWVAYDSCLHLQGCIYRRIERMCGQSKDAITQATCGSELGFAAIETEKQSPQGSVPSYTVFLCLTISGFSKSVTDEPRFYNFALVYMHLCLQVKYQYRSTCQYVK